MPDPTAQPTATGRTTGWMAPTNRPTTMLLLRHGDTHLSPQKRFSGLSDVPLSEAGAGQARCAAQRLRHDGDITAVVSSPLRRARQTAEIVADALGLAVLLEEDLRETDFGRWEGLTFMEAQAAWPEKMARWLTDPTAAPPGGETFADTAARVERARDRLLSRFQGGRILVVSHVTPIKTLVRLALQAPPAALYRMHLDSACLSEIDWYDDGAAVMRSFNDVHHLA